MSQTLVIIIGPPAAGKMTVGLELARLTGFKFMHNHQSIEALLPTFPFGSPSFIKLTVQFRQSVFDEVAASDAPGFIFTTAWNLTSAADRTEIDAYCEPFRRRAARVCFVELEASLDTRIARNRTEPRLQNKASKRDIAASETRLIINHERWTSAVPAPFPYPDSHLKITNDHLAATAVAQTIINHFGIPHPLSAT